MNLLYQLKKKRLFIVLLMVLLLVIFGVTFFIQKKVITSDRLLETGTRDLSQPLKRSSVSQAQGYHLSSKSNPQLSDISLQLRFPHQANPNKNSYLPYLQFDSSYFFNESNSHIRTGVELFAPIWQAPASLFFTDIKVSDYSGTPWEWSVALGFRSLWLEQQSLGGVYAAFDQKRGIFDHCFNQVTVGGEFWFKKLFFGGSLHQIIGNNPPAISIQERAQAMSGGDAEIGYEFIAGFTGYLGGYYFNAKETPTVYGPKAGLQYEWFSANGKDRVLWLFDKVRSELGVHRDKPRGTVWYLNLNVRMGWFTPENHGLTGISRHMLDSLQRYHDIVLVRVTTAEANFQVTPKPSPQSSPKVSPKKPPGKRAANDISSVTHRRFLPNQKIVEPKPDKPVTPRRFF